MSPEGCESVLVDMTTVAHGDYQNNELSVPDLIDNPEVAGTDTPVTTVAG